MSSAARSQPAVDALTPTLLPVAAQARERVLNHPTLAAFEIEQTIKDAVAKASSQIKSPKDAPAARAELALLEQTLNMGPLREIPLIDLHKLMAAIAGAEGNSQEQAYHRAYSIALFMTINRSGDGKTPQTARRIVMIAEEYDWFWFAQQVVQRKARVAKTIDGRMYDIWTATMVNGGTEIELYFDASAMANSTTRVLSTRRKVP